MTYNLSNKEKLQGTKKRIYIAYDKSRKQREEFRDKINEIIQLISNEMEMELNK